MRIKNKRVLKNGAVAGYVYYKKDKKWKWRIVGHVKKNKKGGSEDCQVEWKDIVFRVVFSNDNENIVIFRSDEMIKLFEFLNNKKWKLYVGETINGLVCDSFRNRTEPEGHLEVLKTFFCKEKKGLEYIYNVAIPNESERDESEIDKIRVKLYIIIN